MFGHPFKKPFCVAFRSVDILRLHTDWCANFTLLARVEMEWAKLVVCCTALGRTGSEGDCCAAWIGSVHKYNVVFLYPCRMFFSIVYNITMLVTERYGAPPLTKYMYSNQQCNL